MTPERWKKVEELRFHDTHDFAVAKDGIYFAPKTNPEAGSVIQFFNFGTEEIKTITTVKNVKVGSPYLQTLNGSFIHKLISSGVT